MESLSGTKGHFAQVKPHSLLVKGDKIIASNHLIAVGTLLECEIQRIRRKDTFRSCTCGWLACSILLDTSLADISEYSVDVCTKTVYDVGFAYVTLIQHVLSYNTH